MATGIEIVSLVLGALPVFISAAEQYQAGVRFVKRARKKHKFLTQYRDELLEQNTLLKLYLKAVIGSTDLPPSVQAELVEKPDCTAWQTSNVIKELSKVLGDTYEHFLVLIKEICVTLGNQLRTDEAAESSDTEEEIIHKLQQLCLEVRDAPPNTVHDKSSVWDRIKFSSGQSNREHSLDELKGYTKRLQRLNSAANGAKPYERKQGARKAHATFELRQETERLFQIVSSACNCHSSKPRDVGLGLAVHHHEGASKSDLQFELLLFGPDDSVCCVSVKMTKHSEPCEPVRKKARFNISKSHESSQCKMKKLQDICRESQQATKTKNNLQLVVDEKGEVFTTQAANRDTSPGRSIHSLCDVFSKFKIYNHKRWFHREKAILAVILAYSLLQIHESSWWQSIWNSRNITFIDPGATQLAVHGSLDQRIKLRNPFTRSTIETVCPAPAAHSQVVQKNAHLHALGIVLLELYLNRPLKEEIEAKSAGYYRGVAQDLLEEHYDDMNMTPEYARAVRFCLSPHPNRYTGSFSFQDKGFREIFHGEVISMLEDNLTSRFEVTDSIWLGADS